MKRPILKFYFKIYLCVPETVENGIYDSPH